MKKFVEICSKSFHILIVVCIISTCDILAQTNGPAQIEYIKSSSSAGTVVNEFTGSFTESIPMIMIPGPDGSDFQMNLTYQSGGRPDEPASWVGYGWALNPGAIVRQKRGFPDDYYNIKVKYWNETRPNITSQNTLLIAKEKNSKNTSTGSISSSSGFSIGVSAIFNNYTGYLKQNFMGINANNFSANMSNDSRGNSSFGFDYNIVNLLQNEYIKSDAWSGYLKDIGNSLIYSCLSGVYGRPNLPTYSSWEMPSGGLFYNGTQISVVPKVRASNLDGTDPDLTTSSGYESNIPVQKCCTTVNTETREHSVYGYMYSNEVKSTDNVMDYYTEKDNQLKQSDKYLGIPFPNVDNFSVTGQGNGGSFRVINNNITKFRPVKVNSEIKIDGWGFTGGYVTKTLINPLTLLPTPSVNICLGIDYNWGYNRCSLEGWETKYEPKSILMQTPVKQSGLIFRFSNDMGSFLSPSCYTNLSTTSNIESLVTAQLVIPSNSISPKMSIDLNYLDSALKNTTRSIDYNTFGDIKSSGYNKYLIYSRYLKNNAKVIQGAGNELIAEYSIVNQNGYRYNYGLPVFNRNERSLSYGLNKDNWTVTPSMQSNKLIVNMNVIPIESTAPESTQVVIGTESNEPYVGTYLLTEIYTDDYVDVTGDGPSYDDIGGYTLFNYRRVAGDDIKRDPAVEQWKNENGYTGYAKEMNDKWYKWRSPYSGLWYSQGSLSDYQDDMGSFSMGETEIYYLESIETKTHTAYFITNKTDITVKMLGEDYQLKGSNNNRDDAYEANHNEYKASGGDANTAGDNKLEMLEKIVLLKKDISKLNYQSPTMEYSDLVQTSYLQYDAGYPIWNNQPNSKDNKGKLTLKRIWAEQGNIKEYGLSPYEFSYEYNDNDLPDHLKVATGLTQKPSFSYAEIDAWGDYQKKEIDRINKKQNWVNQSPASDFDPAAWNLKEIWHPSGANTRIQYEQNSYRYVQDKEAQILLPIRVTAPGIIPTPGMDMIINELELSKLGISVSSPIILDQYKNKLVNLLKNKKIYYHFLYNLNEGEPALHDITSEYIDGFAQVADVLTYVGSSELKITFPESIPLSKCIDFYRNNRNKYICFTGSNDISNIASFRYMNEAYVKAQVPTLFLPYTVIERALEMTTLCQRLNPELSYIRLPIPDEYAKKGGGVRVKRLLMSDNFDKKTEGGATKFYGKEYLYIDRAERCSGVATSEPMNSKHDNSLIEFLDCFQPGTYESGRGQQLINIEVNTNNYDEYVGPLGQAVLPSPFVGYSNVFIKDIDITGSNSPSNGGIVEKSFYTCKEYPNKVQFTSLSDNTLTIEQPVNLELFKPNYSLAKYYMTQGYTFLMNNMHGQPKSVSTYKGVINDTKPYDIASLINMPTQVVNYNYFAPNEKIPIYNYQRLMMDYDYLGTEVEILNESKVSKTNLSESSTDVDLEFPLTWLPIPTWAGGGLKRNKSESALYTNVTTKLVSYPAILKSVETKQDGILNIVENIAFDRNSGNPVIVKSNDGFHNLSLQMESGVSHDGTYHKLSIPESNIHKELANASLNQNIKISSVPNKFHLYRRVDYNSNSGKNINEVSLAFDFNYMNSIVNDTNKWKQYYGPIGFLEPYKYKLDRSDTIKDNCWESYYINLFSEGDIVKVVPRGSDAKSFNQELYQVKNVHGNIVSLLPLGIMPNYIIPCSKLEVDAYIERSGRKNKLNNTYAEIATYGLNSTFDAPATGFIKPFNMTKSISSPNGNIPIDEMNKRQELINQLNRILNKSCEWGNGVSYNCSTDPECANFVSALSSVSFRDAYGNPVSYLLTDFQFKSLIEPTVGGLSIGCEFSVKKRNSSNQPGMNYNYPYIDRLNKLYEKLYNVRLNYEIPEIDWFDKSNYVYDGGVIERPDLSVVLSQTDPKRYAMAKLKPEYRTQIEQKLDIDKYKITPFEINGKLYKGEQILKSQSDKMQIDYMELDGKDVYVVIDRYKREVMLGYFIMALCNTKSEILPFGVIRGSFDEQYKNRRMYAIVTTNKAVSRASETMVDGNSNLFQSYDFTNGSVQYGMFHSDDGQKVSFHRFLTDMQIALDVNQTPMPIDVEYCSTPLYWYVTSLEGFKGLYLDENGQIGIALVDRNGVIKEEKIQGSPYNWSKSLSCLEFYDTYTPTYTIPEGVIAASATKSISNWDGVKNYNLNPDKSTTPKKVINKILIGESGQWRSKESYIYKDEVRRNIFGNPDDDRIYYAGTTQNAPFMLIPGNGNSFHQEDIDKYWKKGTTITQYSPYGAALESKNVFGNYTSAYYGQPGYNYYTQTPSQNSSTPGVSNRLVDQSRDVLEKEFVSLVASNAKYGSCAFQSWEHESLIDYSTMNIMDRSYITKDYAHAGQYSRNLSSQYECSELGFEAKTIKVFDNITLPNNMYETLDDYPEKGVLCRLWAKTDEKSDEIETPDCKLEMIIKQGTSTYVKQPFIRKIQTGEWSLYEARVNDWGVDNNPGINSTDPVSIYVKTAISNSTNVFIDDILFRPIEASSQCFVYDYQKQRLSDVLDDNHFVMHYQYDFKGNMTKVMKETGIGMRSIAANSYSMPVKSRGSIINSAPTPYGKINNQPINIPNLNVIMNVDNPTMFLDEDEDQEKDQEIKAVFDIFKLNMSPDKQDVELFNFTKPTVPSVDSLHLIPNSNNIIKGVDKNIDGVKGSIDSNMKEIKDLGKSADSVNANSKKLKKSINTQNVKETIKNSSEKELKSQIKEFKKENVDSLQINKKL